MNFLKKLFGKKQPKQKTWIKLKVMDYAELMANYVLAVKAGNRDEIVHLMEHAVECPFCGEVVWSAKASIAAKDAGARAGSLACPKCKKYWVEWGKGKGITITK